MNVRELLRDLRIVFKEHGESPHVTDGWVGIICPFCGVGTSKYGMGIHLRSLVATCWKCGSHRLGSVLAAATDRPVREILKLLPDVDRVVSRAESPVGQYQEPPEVGPLTWAHENYLRGRGFDPDAVVAEWGIKAIGRYSNLRWRLFLPVYRHGEPLSWTTRTIGRAEPRYLAAKPHQEARPLKSLLYGLDKVRHAVIVTEGPFDAIRIGPGAVATFGVSYSRAQVAALAEIPVRVVCFDNGRLAQQRASQLADLLEPFPGTTSVARLSGKDPASAPEEEICELRSRFLK